MDGDDCVKDMLSNQCIADFVRTEADRGYNYTDGRDHQNWCHMAQPYHRERTLVVGFINYHSPKALWYFSGQQRCLTVLGVDRLALKSEPCNWTRILVKQHRRVCFASSPPDISIQCTRISVLIILYYCQASLPLGYDRLRQLIINGQRCRLDFARDNPFESADITYPDRSKRMLENAEAIV